MIYPQLFAQVTGQSYLLWAIENYAALCKLADEIAAKEEVKVSIFRE
jgi:hypothetical protein